MLDDRKSAILRELVEEYITTGEPVSSRAILERAQLECSAATVRNELAVLENDGYIMKPHTSAGRVPTDRGYRYFVDHLSPGSLRRRTRDRIETFFASMHAELGRMLKDTSDLLAEITHYPALVLGPGLQGQVVRDVHVVQIEPSVVLIVLATEAGRVHQSVLQLADPPAPIEVTEATEALVTRLDGFVLGDDLLSEPGHETGGLSAVALDIYDRILEVVDAAAVVRREVYLGGTSFMTDLWEDLSKLHRILAVLDREATVRELLDAEAVGTSVRLGPEIPAGEDDLAVISSSYGADDAGGRMGVFGPMRMDYRRTIKVVEEVSEALGDSLGG
jgi:heat-inducible transcriptional repressor